MQKDKEKEKSSIPTIPPRKVKKVIKEEEEEELSEDMREQEKEWRRDTLYPTSVETPRKLIGNSDAPRGRSAYEVLGLRSAEPTLRPPILQAYPGARELLGWAQSDCASAASEMRGARPDGPFAAAAFRRLQDLRAVVLAEVAKARDSLEAMAAAGIAFDREMLLLAAEEL